MRTQNAFAITALLASGCSVIAMRDAPKQPTARVPECTDSRIAPGVDMSIGFSFALLAFSFSGVDRNEHGHVGDFVLTTGVIAAALAGAGVIGFVRAHRCDRAKESWRPSPLPITQALDPEHAGRR